MKDILALLAAAALAASGAAAQDHDEHQHKEDHEHHEDHHDHDGHDHHEEMDAGGKGDAGDGALAPPAATPEIRAAAAAGGEVVVADVLGVVCDFCAKAMNKTFGRRSEVAAVHVDLDAKALTLVLKPGETMDDETVETLVKKAGYRTKAVRRGLALPEEGADAADRS